MRTGADARLGGPFLPWGPSLLRRRVDFRRNTPSPPAPPAPARLLPFSVDCAGIENSEPIDAVESRLLFTLSIQGRAGGAIGALDAGPLSMSGCDPDTLVLEPAVAMG